MLIIPKFKKGGIPINRESHACQRSRNTHTPFEAQGFPKVPPKRVQNISFLKKKLYKLPKSIDICTLCLSTRHKNPSCVCDSFQMLTFVCYIILYITHLVVHVLWGCGIHIIMVHGLETFMSFLHTRRIQNNNWIQNSCMKGPPYLGPKSSVSRILAKPPTGHPCSSPAPLSFSPNWTKE